MIFKGSAVALVTPFTKDNKVDFDKLGELVEYQIANGTDAIVSCGTTGEANTMTDEEQLATIKYVVEKVNKRVPVIAGSGSNDTMHSVNLSQEAEKLGVDALLIITPYYNKANKAGLKRHFETIANSVKLPIILYNVPGRTCVNISPSLIVELAKIDNIVAVKEASGDLGQVAEIASLVPDDFAIYSGNDDTILPLLSLGGQGVISVLANVCPQETHDLVAKFFEGDIEGSRKLQLGMDALIAALFIEVNPIPVKTAMNLLGFNVGDLRLPLTEMDPANLEVLKKELVNFGLKVNA
ncbi:UNVERIFIED_CONTAM: 4-hydroxy-tetrahydrodipicolinate synthase [Clostridioides difficile]|uniref:4-hydroxy-tetrahydrodipicolinate synthase n=1 Tax=Clostridioides difficile TaxID=1496 RepID=UPI000825EDB2|nr:4-hydroxy-tetrahydrodipicolinate synthase [Clostridioides difficile]MBY1923132.1 4-hydroxy-tetrahydrodipicolinate synthase [Clostridioides difficile]MCE4902573.1 4-hydroxy-tetrahydrodipicolinate synthase [Clostridioides difficile]MCO5812830.1 4-hydroxy-tetrahydrodipicolinate synthase [Clostridioides difficile]MCW0843360.1 4-hydroxy-tetrahydrodipicolinate synthase [Clostridioides difficile]PBG21321.1 4-hydroxy-tetrahydrodipicolinate synthase [Clostridioides difficile]